MTEPVPTRPPRPKPPEIMEPVFDENGEVLGWIIPSTGEFVPNPLYHPDEVTTNGADGTEHASDA